MDILENIKAAEDNADRIKAEALSESQRIASESEKAARDEAQKMILKAKEESERISLDAVRRADAETEKAVAERADAVSALEKGASAKISDAVKKITELI